MKVLVLTHMYPTHAHPENGIFVQQQVESLKREGIDIHVLHVDVKKTRFLYPWSIVPFIKEIYKNSYDLIHAHYVFAGIIARSEFRVPVIVTHHGDEAFYGWQSGLCKIVSQMVDYSIVVSDQIKRSINVKHAEVIPCGVDYNLFFPTDKDEARSILGLPKDQKLILFAGDKSKPLKRFDLAQAAVERLKNNHLDAELVTAYKLPYGLIPLYMNACDVLLLPSEREGSPQVVKEAMACNLPVVSTDVGDVKQVFEGVDGCYICERNTEDIAAKLYTVLKRGERTNGRKLTSRYEIGSIAKRIISVYEKLLKESS